MARDFEARRNYRELAAADLRFGEHRVINCEWQNHRTG
jgi:hypothetical protein